MLAIACSEAGGPPSNDFDAQGSATASRGGSAGGDSVEDPAMANAGGNAGSAPSFSGVGGDEDPRSDAPVPVGPARVDELEVGDRAADLEDTITVQGTFSDPQFRIWLPGGVSVIRGVYVNAGLSVHYQEFARLVNFALLQHTDLGDSYVPIATLALQQFADRTGHPELVNAPVVGTGHSASSSAIFDFIQNAPARTIAGAPGGLEFLPAGNASLRVPFLEWYGSVDAAQSKVQVANLETARASHGLYAIAPQWGNGHYWSLGTNIAHPWLYQAIARRYPKGASPLAGPVELLEVAESEGWLGDRNGWLMEPDGRFKYIEQRTLPTISAWASFMGDPSKAIWLLDSYTAHVWRAFTAPDDAVKIIDPNPQNSDEKPPVTLVEPGAPLAVQVQVEGAQKVELYDGDALLGEASAPYGFSSVLLQPGVHALVALATMDDGRQLVSRPSTIYAVRVPCPAPDPTAKFPIRCVRKP